MKLYQLYIQTRERLLHTEEEQYAVFLARELIRFVSGNDQFPLTGGDMDVSDGMLKALDALICRAEKGEPLAYILGNWPFYGLQLTVDSRVLIPRDDTCAVTDLAIKTIHTFNQPKVLDLCTGSGCIGLAIASRISDARVTLADISEDALAVARKNIQQNRLTQRVTAVNADVFTMPGEFENTFDLIVSNPPYITTGEMAELPDSVKNYEPHLALHGGQDGLDFYRAIIKEYTPALRPGGYMCFEFGMGQGDGVCELLHNNGYTILERSRDYNQVERCCIAQYTRKE